MTVNCYPVHGKKKALVVCEAFAAGCGGQVITDGKLRDGDAFFYGVDESIAHIWRAVLYDHSRTFYYADNSYFDATRGSYFRVTRNMFQHYGIGRSDGTRFRQLKIDVQPWREDGDYILICPQSESFMLMPVGYEGNWVENVSKEIRHFSKRPIVVHTWGRDKSKQSESFKNHLENAHAVVVWSSAAAINAVLAGVGIVAQGQSAALPMSGSIDKIENLPRQDRTEWLGVLADNQWTLDEIARGITWSSIRSLRGRKGGSN